MYLQCVIVWVEHENGQFYHKILKSAAVLEFLLLVVASLASATTLPFVQIGIQILPNYLDQRTKWFHIL